jgi:hypothetical protein
MEYLLHFPTVSEYPENLIPDGYPIKCPLGHEMIQGIEWSCSLDDFSVPGSYTSLLAHATPEGIVLVESCSAHPLFCRIVPIHSCCK